MLIVAAGIGLALLPIAVTLALLGVAARVQRGRAEAVARQIGLTDAIHREFGAVVAPLVEKRRGRRWRAVIAVPFTRPDLVARVVALAEHTLAQPHGGSVGVEVLLTPQAVPPAPPSRRGRAASAGRSENVWPGLGRFQEERHTMAAVAGGEAILR